MSPSTSFFLPSRLQSPRFPQPWITAQKLTIGLACNPTWPLQVLWRQSSTYCNPSIRPSSGKSCHFENLAPTSYGIVQLKTVSMSSSDDGLSVSMPALTISIAPAEHMHPIPGSRLSLGSVRNGDWQNLFWCDVRLYAKVGVPVILRAPRFGCTRQTPYTTSYLETC